MRPSGEGSLRTSRSRQYSEQRFRWEMNPASSALTSSLHHRSRAYLFASPRPEYATDPDKTTCSSVNDIPLLHVVYCGGGGIRTHGDASATTVFETAPINHSGTPPYSVVSPVPLSPAKKASISARTSPSSTPDCTCSRWFSQGDRTMSYTEPAAPVLGSRTA